MRTQEDLKLLYEKNTSRYEKHLHHRMDITSIILKGHLFAEELLMDILRLHCRDSKPIENIQLSFQHKLKLVQALFGSHLTGFKYPEKIWPVLDNLNQLRNALAHQIDSPKAVTRLNAFVTSFCQLFNKDVKISIVEAIPVSDKDLTDELLRIMFYLLGFLGCIHGIAYLNPPSPDNKNTPIRIPDPMK